MAVRFFRLVKSEYAMSAFDGFGARTYGALEFRGNGLCLYGIKPGALCT